LKVLILTALYPPLGFSGHDERCRQVAAALTRKGHRVQVLTSNYRMPPGFGGEKGVFRELNLDRSYPKDSGMGEHYQLTHQQAQSNSDAVFERVDRFDPDVIYVWNREDLGRSILFGLQARNFPMVYDLHSNWLAEDVFEDDSWIRWWRKNESKRSRLYQAYLRVTGVARRVQNYSPIGCASDLDLSNAYVCSESLRHQLIDSGFEEARTMPLIYPSLDLSNMRQKKNYRVGGTRFMWAGRLSKGKDPECALRAIRALKDQGIDVTVDFFALGEPGEKKSFRNQISALDIGERVSILGTRPGELIDHYKAYDALLFTSSCQDPFPMTPLEAMFSKLPCILSEDGGIAEIVEDRRSAFTYISGDSDALAAAIVGFTLLDDGGEKLANENWANLDAKHLLEKSINKIEEILFSSIDSKANKVEFA